MPQGQRTEAEILNVLEKWMTMHLLRVKDFFFKLDIDKSGALSVAEFVQLFSMLGMGNQIPEAQMRQLFATLDGDGSGDVTLEELRRHIRRRRLVCEREGMSRVAERVKLGGGTKFETVQFGLT